MKRPLWCAAVLLAPGACAAPTSDPGPRAITAREAITLRGADGATRALPVDLDAAVIQAYARDADGGWTVHAGAGTSAGELEVAAVPPGGAWLRVDYAATSAEAQVRNEYFWIDGDEDVALDLGTWRHGRADAAIARTSPTAVRLGVSGLAPWQPGLDLAVLYAPNVGFVQVFSQDVEGISGVPREGATGGTIEVDWAGALAAPLVDHARGDVVHAMQFRFVPRGDVFVGTAIRATTLTEVALADGAAAEVAVPLAATAPVRARVALDRDAFDALRPGLGADTGPALGRGFAIDASPTPLTDGYAPGSTSAQLLVLDGAGADGTGRLDLGDVEIASPLPAADTYATAIAAYPVSVPRDDGFIASAQAEVGVLTPVLPTEGAPLAPLLGPVRDVTIAGRPAFASPTGVGLTPEIAWAPPALGAPTEYEVRVLAPGGFDPRYGFGWYAAAVFHVPGDQTSLALPPETLAAELPYALHIRAISNALPAEGRARAPRQQGLPYGWADTITPAFAP